MKHKFKPRLNDFSKPKQLELTSYVGDFISNKKKVKWQSGSLKDDLGFRKLLSAYLEDPSIYKDPKHARKRLHYLVPELLNIYVKNEKLAKKRKSKDNARTYYVKR